MNPQNGQPTIEELRLHAVQLRMQITSDEDFEAYLDAWVENQRAVRVRAQEQLAQIEAAIAQQAA